MSFPADALVRVHLSPAQAFGDAADGGRTVVRGVGTLIQFDMTSGRHSAQSSLKPLKVGGQQDAVTLRGRVLELRTAVASVAELAQTIETIYFAYPWLLSVAFVDPVVVERVEGEVGGVAFEWQLSAWRLGFEPTTQVEQERKTLEAWTRLELLAPVPRRRLVAALHYFHVACRLEREAGAPGEFMAEVLLNLAKTAQVLFPGADGETIDAARRGLATLGYTSSQIEARFVPVLALRSELDVAHVQLADLTKDQLTTVHSYIELAEGHFRELLRRVLEGVETGTWEVEQYEPANAAPRAVRVIDRMEAALREEGAAES